VAEGAQALADEEAADLDELYRLVEQHAAQTGATVKLHELLAGSEVIDRCEDPVLDEEGRPLSELDEMRAKSQERAYQRMVDGVSLHSVHRVEPAEHQKGLRFATNFGTQVIVAFIGAFLLGYYFVETFVAPESFNAKVIAGAACSFATLLLETLLLVIHEHKLTMIHTRQTKQDKRSRRLVAVRPPVAPSKSEPEKKDD
ncbi:unnamed protein product, partial [Symbiodinium sp. KB8]